MPRRDPPTVLHVSGDDRKGEPACEALVEISALLKLPFWWTPHPRVFGAYRPGSNLLATLQPTPVSAGIRLAGLAAPCRGCNTDKTSLLCAKMLYLSFKRLGNSSAVAPVATLEFRGGAVFVGGEPAPLARYSLGQWVYANEKWSYAESSSRILVQFVDYGGTLGAVVGPRPSMRLRDRFLFAGRERVGTLNPLTGLWQEARTQESWPIVRVTSHL